MYLPLFVEIEERKSLSRLMLAIKDYYNPFLQKLIGLGPIKFVLFFATHEYKKTKDSLGSVLNYDIANLLLLGVAVLFFYRENVVSYDELMLCSIVCPVLTKLPTPKLR